MGKNEKNSKKVAALENDYTKEQYVEFQKQQKQLIFRRRRLAAIFLVAFIIFAFSGIQLMKDYHRLGAFKQERADAIAESFDATARVTNTSEGNIAVIFTKKPGTNTQSKLGLKICNTEDFIKKNHIQEIIKEVIDEIQQEKATTGTGPSTSGTNRPSVPIKPVPSDETQISKVTADKNAVLVIPEYSELIKSTFNILKSKTDSPSVDAKSIQKSTVIKCSTNEEILARLSLAKS